MRLAISILLLSSLFISCDDDTPTLDIPQCIDDELQAFIPEACAGTSDLTLWRFKGQDLYCFNYGACLTPTYADIFDANCNLICTLGGDTNNDICDGDSWSASAVQLSLLYQN